LHYLYGAREDGGVGDISLSSLMATFDNLQIMPIIQTLASSAAHAMEPAKYPEPTTPKSRPEEGETIAFPVGIDDADMKKDQ
jgi:hypothetical protein